MNNIFYLYYNLLFIYIFSKKNFKLNFKKSWFFGSALCVRPLKNHDFSDFFVLEKSWFFAKITLCVLTLIWQRFVTNFNYCEILLLYFRYIWCRRGSVVVIMCCEMTVGWYQVYIWGQGEWWWSIFVIFFVFFFTDHILYLTSLGSWRNGTEELLDFSFNYIISFSSGYFIFIDTFYKIDRKTWWNF